MQGVCVKAKNVVRTYDNDGFRRRAACLCFKDSTEREILLVSAGRAPEVWIVPGGGVEPSEAESVAAHREVLEEAGVKGQLDRCIGVFESNDCKTRTFVFVMIISEMLDEWEEARSMGRKRKWFLIDEARKHLQLYRPAQLHYLNSLYATQSNYS